jgi:uncharacterized protein with FMN-binding domain
VVNGERTELNRPAEGPPPRETRSAARRVTTSEIVQRTAAEVDALVDRMGRTPPVWFGSTPLEFPPTLDLTWPEDPNAVWNYTRNVDHYLWDIIDTNPARYRGGVRLMHHLLMVNQDIKDTRDRVMNELGRMYFEFFKDYARAAFWWRQAGVIESEKFSSGPGPARLAECYWRLGNRPMAITLLDRIPLTYAVIKLWGELKETDHALTLGEAAIERGLEASEVVLLLGDACRVAERYDEAVRYYQKALDVPAEGKNKESIERNQRRARDTLEMIRLFDRLEIARVKPGTYQDQSYGYAGNVRVEAVVKDHRLQSLRVTSLSDKQYYHAVDETIRRIVDRQSVKGVDAISGATITSEAVIRASAKALAQGME